jgi:hypothetical protein
LTSPIPETPNPLQNRQQLLTQEHELLKKYYHDFLKNRFDAPTDFATVSHSHSRHSYSHALLKITETLRVPSTATTKSAHPSWFMSWTSKSTGPAAVL